MTKRAQLPGRSWVAIDSEASTVRLADPAAPELLAADLIRALNAAWSAIRARHAELPGAVLIVASAGDGRRRVWGHWGASRWNVGGAPTGEVMIAGELLAPGGGNHPADPAPVRVLGTLLHEAAHALAHARGVKDTSRGGRYHNARFRDVAGEVGLEVEAHPAHGWCLTRPGAATVLEYAQALAALGAALRGHRAAEPHGTGAAKPGGGLLKACCGCRSIRIARGAFGMGAIRCEACDEAFELEPPG